MVVVILVVTSEHCCVPLSHLIFITMSEIGDTEITIL